MGIFNFHFIEFENINFVVFSCHFVQTIFSSEKWSFVHHNNHRTSNDVEGFMILGRAHLPLKWGKWNCLLMTVKGWLSLKCNYRIIRRRKINVRCKTFSGIFRAKLYNDVIKQYSRFYFSLEWERKKSLQNAFSLNIMQSSPSVHFLLTKCLHWQHYKRLFR